MRLYKAKSEESFKKISNGRYIGNNIFADNGQVILDQDGDMRILDLPHYIGEMCVTIPLEEIDICKTNYDLSEYGFEKINIYWVNKKEKKMEKDIYKLHIPAGNPEQLIFNRREDGYYDVTIKSYAIDSTGNSILLDSKCVAMLPDWIAGCIPLEVIKQENGELFTVEFPEN